MPVASRCAQAILTQLEADEGSHEMRARARAHDKLHAMLWSQVLTQAAHLADCVSNMHTVDYFTTEVMRKHESISGWLDIQVDDTYGEHGGEHGTRFFFGLSGST